MINEFRRIWPEMKTFIYLFKSDERNREKWGKYRRDSCLAYESAGNLYSVITTMMTAIFYSTVFMD